MARRWLAAWVVLELGAGCQRWVPPAPESVRLYVAPGLPGELVAELARGFGIARPRLVATVEEAEVAWLRSPSDALALGERAAADSAPEQPRMPDPFMDPKRRFAPLGAIATVIVGSSRRAEPFTPSGLAQLADRRLRRRVALAPLGRGEGPRLVAALELAYGERGTKGWLGQLAGNEPILVDDPAEVVAAVEAGRAAYGIVDSLTAGAAMARGEVRVLFPDQQGGGCVVVPTALVVLPGAGHAARKLSAWLASPDAEAVICLRVPGLLPIRDGGQATDGLLPVWKLTHPSPDWSALAEREVVWRGTLAGWPRRGPSAR